jgi:hypothetical protein
MAQGQGQCSGRRQRVHGAAKKEKGEGMAGIIVPPQYALIALADAVRGSACDRWLSR